MRSSLLLVLLMASGCVHTRGAHAVSELRFDDELITGDLALDKLNDEELFAAATSFYAAEDYAQAARYFGRIGDFHQSSKHYRPALYNAGLALEKLKAWDDAWARFSVLADARGVGDALDAAFRLAEVDYHLDHATQWSLRLGIGTAEANRRLQDGRGDLSSDKRIEARVQQGICELEGGNIEAAELTLRGVLSYWNSVPDKDLVDDYFPGQAQFFLGEIFRRHYEDVQLDGNKSTDKLTEDLEYKSELLLSSQGHYLRAIRIGNGYWATAAGNRIGGLYENMYDHMVHAPAPAHLSSEEQQVYRAELRKKIRVLISKAINVYERTLEAAERIGAASPFVQQTRVSLQRMKQLLLAEVRDEEAEQPGSPPGS